MFELEVLQDFAFSDERSGSCKTTIFGLKLYTVFFIAEPVQSNSKKLITQVCLNQKLI